MKTTSLLTAGLYVLLLTRSVIVSAQDRQNPNYGAPMSSGDNGGMNRTRFGLPMPQQWSRVRPTGMSRGFNGQSVGGQSVGARFSNGNYSSGYRGMSNCPNGQCPQRAQSGGMSFNTRSMPADPFRRSGDLSGRDQWTQRPVVAPLNDAYRRFGYDRNDLNLRSEYFGDESDKGDDFPAQTQPNSNFNSNEWTRPSRRSMEAPASTRSGIVRF